MGSDRVHFAVELLASSAKLFSCPLCEFVRRRPSDCWRPCSDAEQFLAMLTSLSVTELHRSDQEQVLLCPRQRTDCCSLSYCCSSGSRSKPEFLPLGCSQIPSAWVLPDSFRLSAPKFLPLGCSRIPSSWVHPNSFRLEAPEFLPIVCSRIPSACSRIPSARMLP